MNKAEREAARKHPLATLGGIELMLALMVGSGGMCIKCGHGTRVTSKRWAKCKSCGHRNQRRPMEDVADAMKTVLRAKRKRKAQP